MSYARSRRSRRRRSADAWTSDEVLLALGLGVPCALGLGWVLACVAFAAARSWGIA